MPETVRGRDLHTVATALRDAAWMSGVVDPAPVVFVKHQPANAPIRLFTEPGRTPFPGTQDGVIGATRTEAMAWMRGALAAYQVAFELPDRYSMPTGSQNLADTDRPDVKGAKS